MDNFRIDFIGLGAPKCATSWLTFCLAEHPQIQIPKMNLTNELNYFSKSRANNTKSEYDISGINGYIHAFKECDFSAGEKIGEMSTHYLADKETAITIKTLFPNTKLIISLRNPISRAYSQYVMYKDFALIEKDDFETAFYKRKKDPFPTNYYLMGLYYMQLKPYFSLFPRKNIKVILLDDINKNPKKVIKELYKFLNVDDTFIPPSLNKRINDSIRTKYPLLRKFINLGAKTFQSLDYVGLGKITSFVKRRLKFDLIVPKLNEKNSIVKEKEKIPQETMDKLKKEYRDDIEKLEKLIKRDLSMWK